MHGATLAGFLTTASLLVDLRPSGSPRRGFWMRVALLFLTGALLRGSAVVASPDPVIDVYGWLRDAPGHLLRGHNPYAATYDSPYETEHARRLGVLLPAEARPAAYPPLPILVAAPFRAAGLDVRWANAGCDLVAALALLLAGRTRGRPVTGALLAGAYLHLPQAPFLIEQAWYEPMLAATLGTGLWLVERRRWGYVLLALGLTGKQFGVVLLPSLWQARRGERLALLAGLALVLAVVWLPFYLAGPADFLAVVLTRHLERPVAYSSLTVLSGCRDLLGVELPRQAVLLAGCLAIGGVAWTTPRAATGTGLWLGTALFVFCLAHTQGFFNYYCLCQYLWLLGVAGLAAPAAPAAGSGERGA
jgi:hypothetical protein